MHATVEALLRDVAASELLPRFRRLAPHEIREKGPGELVTAADVAAERAIAAGLRELAPGSVVIGEEACASDPALVRGLARHELAWLVDPLDGTAHFASGRDSFGIMVSLLRRGRPRAAWIHLPTVDCTVVARAGHGVTVDGRPVRIPSPPPLDSPDVRGALMTRFVPEPLRSRIESRREPSWKRDGHACAARRYADIVLGREHFALFYRTLPWDHAAGALIVEEAGGLARRFDGSAYRPADVDAVGLLVAADAASWGGLRDRLLPDDPAAPAG